MSVFTRLTRELTNLGFDRGAAGNLTTPEAFALLNLAINEEGGA